MKSLTPIQAVAVMDELFGKFEDEVRKAWDLIGLCRINVVIDYREALQSFDVLKPLVRLFESDIRFEDTDDGGVAAVSADGKVRLIRTKDNNFELEGSTPFIEKLLAITRED